MENEGFSDNGETQQVVGETRRRQMTLLEETRDQTVPHASAREFQCRTGDRCVVRRFSARLPS